MSHRNLHAIGINGGYGLYPPLAVRCNTLAAN
nr:MAG TPA: hypothetical protein [Caudoviricetes sp.]